MKLQIFLFAMSILLASCNEHGGLVERRRHAAPDTLAKSMWDVRSKGFGAVHGAEMPTLATDSVQRLDTISSAYSFIRELTTVRFQMYTHERIDGLQTRIDRFGGVFYIERCDTLPGRSSDSLRCTLVYRVRGNEESSLGVIVVSKHTGRSLIWLRGLARFELKHYAYRGHHGRDLVIRYETDTDAITRFDEAAEFVFARHMNGNTREIFEW